MSSLLAKLTGIKNIFKDVSSFYIRSPDEPLRIAYSENLNITELHPQIIRRIKLQQEKNIPELNQRITEIQEKIKSAPCPVDKKYYEMKRREFEEKKELEEKSVDRFIATTQSILENFEQVKKLENKELRTRALLRVISEYLDTVSNFIPCEITRENKNLCTFCKSRLQPVVMDGIKYCQECSAEISPEIISYNIHKESIVYRYNTYEDRENFWKALIRFQGKQNVKLPDNLFRDLDEYFLSYGLPTGEEIKRLPLDERGRRGNTTKELMFRALLYTGYSAFYEDINLICHLYWNWELPEIGYLEESIMQDYDQFQSIYQQIKTQRKSCLSTQFILYKLLRKNQYPCYLEDFKIVKTREILEFHEKVYSQVCEILGWSNESII